MGPVTEGCPAGIMSRTAVMLTEVVGIGIAVSTAAPKDLGATRILEAPEIATPICCRFRLKELQLTQALTFRRQREINANMFQCSRGGSFLWRLEATGGSALPAYPSPSDTGHVHDLLNDAKQTLRITWYPQ